MVLQLFSIFDKKTRIYHPPIFAHNAGHGLRILSDVFSNKDSLYFNHRDDFEVYEIGSFNDQTGGILPIVPARLLSCARELIQTEESEEDNAQ